MSRVGGNSVSLSGLSAATRTGNVLCPSPRRAHAGVLFQIMFGGWAERREDQDTRVTVSRALLVLSRKRTSQEY
jgi:hypothetical protein